LFARLLASVGREAYLGRVTAMISVETMTADQQLAYRMGLRAASEAVGKIRRTGDWNTGTRANGIDDAMRAIIDLDESHGT
jgi:hypothetical protein